MMIFIVFLMHLSFGKKETAGEFGGTNTENHDVNDIIKLRCSPADECFPSQQEVASLNENLVGRVIVPHMEEYANQSRMYNTLEQRYPRLVVMVYSKEDIQKTVLFARKYNLHVTIRSSGHDFVGRSTWDGSININLSEMKEYQVIMDSERSEHGEIQVQTGWTWGELYEMLDQIYNRTIVGGFGQTVTPGGYTLGGGTGPLSRSLGYGLDNVLELQVVLADGRIATCIESRCDIEGIDNNIEVENGDLFWALRGGGGGTFGVVVYFVFKLHPMPAGMVGAFTWLPLKVHIDNFTFDYSTGVLAALGKLITSIPREWGGSYIISNENTTSQGTHMSGYLLLYMNKFGPWDGSEENVFKEFIDIASDLHTDVVFTNFSSFWDYQNSDLHDDSLFRTYIVNTLLQPENVNKVLLNFFQQELFTNFKNIPLECVGALVGGRTTEYEVDSAALHHGFRTAISTLTCGVGLADPVDQLWFDQAKHDEHLIYLADGLSERLRRFGNGMYLNEPTKNNPKWQEDFWGYHYGRLLEIKKFYDPENFFTCHHCVGSDESGISTIP